VPRARRKAFDSVCALVARCIWLHRNEAVFRNGSVLVTKIILDIDFHLDGWIRAGLIC
jgi:hypothetical protein